MIRLKRIRLENFRGFETLEFDFPASNILVLFGENGSGKSSFLDALAAALNGLIYFKNAASNTLQDKDINTGHDTCLIELNVELPELAEVKMSKTPGNSFKTQLDKSMKIDERLGKNNLPVLAYYKTNRELGFQESYWRTRQKRDDGLIGYRNGISTKVDDYQDFVAWFRTEEDIENQEKVEKRNLDYISPALNTVRLALERFLYSFNKDMAELKVKRSSSRENEKSSYSWNELTDIVIQKAGQELSLTQLSSGERAIILLVADIARRASILNENLSDPSSCKGIVLIDELELHLHPKWQRSAIPALRETFPNIYFVIATHSPQVLSYVEKGSVFEVENFHLKPRHTYGRDNRWILEAVMDDEERPVEIQEKLEIYFSLIREGDIEKANEVRSLLEAKIGTDEPEFAKADILIRRKEKAALQ